MSKSNISSSKGLKAPSRLGAQEEEKQKSIKQPRNFATFLRSIHQKPKHSVEKVVKKNTQGPKDLSSEIDGLQLKKRKSVQYGT